MVNSVSLLGVKGGPAIGPGTNMPTSTLVRMEGMNILVDAGLGATRGICDQGVQLTEIDLILITHLHSDHYLELGSLLHTAWVAGLTKPIRILGPKVLDHYWKHFCEAMSFDISLRLKDEGRCNFSNLAMIETMKPGRVSGLDGLNITAMLNDHPPIRESYALKLSTDITSLVLSGDTAFMPEMIEFAKGAELLVHEAMLIEGVDALLKRITNGDERLREHIMRSHCPAADVGRIASKADVKALAVNHFVPDGDPNFGEEAWEREIRTTWQGPLHIGCDGMTITF